MRRIPLRRQPAAPFMIRGEHRGRVMKVFAFAVDEFAERTGFERPTHRKAIGSKRRRFRTSCTADPSCARRRATPGRRPRSRTPLATVQATSLPCFITVMQCRAWRIGRDENRFERRVLHHFFERVVPSLGNGRQRPDRRVIGDKIGDGGHRDIRMILKSESGAELAIPIASNADANLSIGHRDASCWSGPQSPPRFAENLGIESGWRRQGMPCPKPSPPASQCQCYRRMPAAKESTPWPSPRNNAPNQVPSASISTRIDGCSDAQ